MEHHHNHLMKKLFIIESSIKRIGLVANKCKKVFLIGISRYLYLLIDSSPFGGWFICIRKETVVLEDGQIIRVIWWEEEVWEWCARILPTIASKDRASVITDELHKWSKFRRQTDSCCSSTLHPISWLSLRTKARIRHNCWKDFIRYDCRKNAPHSLVVLRVQIHFKIKHWDCNFVDYIA